MKNINLRAFAVTAIMGAISFVLMLLEFPLPFIIPSFIKLDFSEIPALITAFALGPWYAVAVCLIKNLIHLSITSTLGVGELSNFLLGAVFVCVCGYIYKYRKTRKIALISCLIGAASMAVFSVLSNYFIIYPAYINFVGFPLEAILDMYKAILPSSDTLFKDLVIFNMPFTFAKGVIDSAVCFLVYKSLSPIIKNNG
ncbi:MAG: ECF transporter S component [Clostridia bacterium]|nr:ECF transporter S component [Clostridia bacterium]